MTLEKKISVLKSISEIAPENASAEDEEKENMFSSFLPLRSYSKLADAKVFLITGGRGAGKSKLFHVLTSSRGLEHILSEPDRRRYTKLNEAIFLVGYQSKGMESKNFPTKNVFDKYAKMKSEDQITCLWGGLLCFVLLKNFLHEEEFEEIAQTFLGRRQIEALYQFSHMPEKWLGWMVINLEKWETFLDRCDDYFNRKKSKFLLPMMNSIVSVQNTKNYFFIYAAC